MEEITEQYLTNLDSDDEDFNSSNTYILGKLRCQSNVKLSKRSQSSFDPFDSIPNKETIYTQNTFKMHVKKLDEPKFSGNLREFPIVTKDCIKYTEPTFGEDAYALRNSLSGKALQCVIGADDDYHEMRKRLKIIFGDSEKLVDSVLSEIRRLKPVKEYDANSIQLVNLLDNGWLDLKLLLYDKMHRTLITTDPETRVDYIEAAKVIK